MSHRIALARGRSRIPEVPAESSDHEQDSQLEHELIRQNSLGYGGLIAIGVILVQPFLTAVALDPSAKICIAANSVAIPLLAALILVNRQEIFRRRRTKSTLVAIAQVIAQGCAFVGVVAGFWHILWIAGAGVLTAGLTGVAVHSAGYARLERDQGANGAGSEIPATRSHSPLDG